MKSTINHHDKSVGSKNSSSKRAGFRLLNIKRNRFFAPASLRMALVASVLTLMTACSSLPKPIAVDNPKALPAFSEVVAEPEEYSASPVVFGGKIVAVTNHEDHSVVEILQYPLWDSGRPKTDADKTGGRFRALVKEFLDPELYAKGRLITVRGLADGKEEGKIGDHVYPFLRVAADGIYLWREETDSTSQTHLMMHSGFYSPYFYPRTRIIIAPPPKD